MKGIMDKKADKNMDKKKGIKKGIIAREKAILHDLFKASILIKVVLGIVEAIVGIVFFFLTPALITKAITAFFAYELSEDPTDFIATHLMSLSQGLLLSGTLFIAFYLLVHGLIKIGLVAALWKQKLWA